MKVSRPWRTILGLGLQAGVLLALVGAFFVRVPQVSGDSMEPTIRSGEFVVINTLAYSLGPIRRGDIVAFAHDGTPPEIFIKRVVGLPGETISIDRGHVSINGLALPEPYVKFSDTRSLPSTVIPAGDLFVLGDNRPTSDDSRHFGPIPTSDVIGKAMASLWPLSHTGAL